MQALAMILYLASFACSIIILIHAFQASVGQGFLCLCIPFYILYYAFARFQHAKKNLILAVWLGCGILGAVIMGSTGGFAAYSSLE